MFVIRVRDGLETDLAACLALDHRYTTEQVWQMTVFQESGNWQIAFKTDRLPRTMEVEYPKDARRMRLCLPEEHCFLVATLEDRDGETPTETLGYLTMSHDAAHRIARLRDVVVGVEYRRQGIGKRLLRAARRWATEQGATRMMAETQTKNYPAISFCVASGFAFCGYNDQYFENQDIAVFFAQTIAQSNTRNSG